MSKPMNEQKVLKKLGIENFRHLTKDKVMTMVSMLDKMDPEVAKKAIEQFPEFACTIKDVLKEMKDTLDKAMESNDKSVVSYYDTCDNIIQSLQKELEKETLSFEERQYIIEQMKFILEMKGEKDSENKKFILSLATMAVAAVGITAAVLSAALGGNTQLKTNDTNFLDD